MTPEQCARNLSPQTEAAEQPERPELSLVPQNAPEGAFFSPVRQPNFDTPGPREYCLDELHAFFTPDEIKAAEATEHFKEPEEEADADADADAEQQLDEPNELDFSKFHPTFSDRIHILENNFSSYSDGIEDAIASDGVIEEIAKQLKAASTRDTVLRTSLVQRYRARRSVIAYLESMDQYWQ